jgi:uncharacterized protein
LRDECIHFLNIAVFGLCFGAVCVAQELKRPQLPKPPFPYEIEEVKYAGKYGTLTLPKVGAPFTAVVLIQDTGAEDRDATIAGHKPFLVIADNLTRRGFAVVRVDGSAHLTLEERADDALRVIDHLKSRKDIDAARIGLIGHGEGGDVAALAASRSKDVGFIVILNASGIPGEKLLVARNELTLRTTGAPTEIVDWQTATMRQMIAAIKGDKDERIAAQKVAAIWERAKAQLPEPLRAQAGPIESQITTLNTREGRSALAFDPGAVLRKLKVPVLAINARNDMLVPCSENSRAIELALKGSSEDTRVGIGARLNHRLQTCDKCTADEYGALEETISPFVLRDIGDWMTNHIKRPEK